VTCRWIRVDNLLHWTVGYHAYTYVLGALNVCHWRGVWVLLDYYTGVNVVSVWTSFAIGWLCPNVITLLALSACGAGSMKRYGVCPAVCPIRPLQQRAAGLLLWARRIGDIDRLF